MSLKENNTPDQITPWMRTKTSHINNLRANYEPFVKWANLKMIFFFWNCMRYINFINFRKTTRCRHRSTIYRRRSEIAATIVCFLLHTTSSPPTSRLPTRWVPLCHRHPSSSRTITPTSPQRHLRTTLSVYLTTIKQSNRHARLLRHT